jgi:hypothetical protein
MMLVMKNILYVNVDRLATRGPGMAASVFSPEIANHDQAMSE